MKKVLVAVKAAALQEVQRERSAKEGSGKGKEGGAVGTATTDGLAIPDDVLREMVRVVRIELEKVCDIKVDDTDD